MTKANMGSGTKKEDGGKQQKYAGKKQGAVLKVDAFAHRKGVTKGLQSFRLRKETKRMQTSKQLRSYKRAMKKEGYEPGTGASRKRQVGESNEGEHGNDDSNNQSSENVAANEVMEESLKKIAGTIASVSRMELSNSKHSDASCSRNKQASKQAFYQKGASKESDRRKQQQEQIESQQEDRFKQKMAALKHRRQRHKLLTARTSRGQPVMKNMVQDILNQLQQSEKK